MLGFVNRLDAAQCTTSATSILFLMRMRTPTCCLLAASLLSFVMAPVGVQAKDYLRACWQKQVEPLQAQCMVLNYQETVNELPHA